jgi:dolichyl-phosphate-mannose-protein mannosyltransferase
MCVQANEIDSPSGQKLRESTKPGMQRATRPSSRIVVLILVVHTGMIAWGALRHSPTVDEPAYLASGISHWTFGRFDLYRVSPPLVRMVAALPIGMAGAQYDWSRYQGGPGVRAEHRVGHSFLLANGERSFLLVTLGRWACIPFSLLGAWICYCWAGRLFGRGSALTALLIWCFSPSILAHAQLLTPDIGVTSLSLATCYAFWRWSIAPTWWRTFISGGTLGLAVLAKTNALALFPALVLGISLQAVSATQLRTKRTATQVFVAFLISLYVVNLGYGFERSFRRLGDYEFFSRTLGSKEANNRFEGTILEHVPVPLPAGFLEGIDLQRRDFENSHGTMKTYFRGQWYDRGWWWYYLYVIGVKVPIGIGALVLIGATNIALGRAHRIECICYLLTPGATLLALACTQTGFGHGVRYILPAFPFAFIIASAAMRGIAGDWQRRIAFAALAWLLATSLWIFPHSYSYMNELAGGPRKGHFHLLDGNMDWGQDVLYTRNWLESHPEKKPVHTACWGLLPLEELGIDVTEPDLGTGSSIPSGWYLISVNHLRGDTRLGHPELARFLQYEPAQLVTYTVYAYHVP